MNEPKVRVACTKCGRKLVVDRSHDGRRGQCPGCRNVFTIRFAATTTPAPAPVEAPPPDPLEEARARVAERLEARDAAEARAAREREEHEARWAQARAEFEVRLAEASREHELRRAEERERLEEAHASERAELEARHARERERLEADLAEARAEAARLRRGLQDSEETRKEALREFKEEILGLYEEKELLLRREKEAGEEVAEARSREEASLRELAEARSRVEELEEDLRRAADAARRREEEPAGLSEEARLLTGQRVDAIRRMLENVVAETDRLRRELVEPASPVPARTRMERPPPSPPWNPATGRAERERPDTARRAPVEREESGAASTVRGFRDLRSVGFDFGTSTTVASFYKGVSEQGIFEIGIDPKGGYRRLAVPSVIGYLEDEDRFIAGEDASELPSNLAGFRKIPSVKRCLLCEGVSEAGVCANIKNTHNHDICGRGVEPWRLGPRRYETEDLIARYLMFLLDRIERKYDLKLDPSQVHFTVPVYFGYIARKKMREGVRRAFALLRGVSEDDIPVDSITLIHEPSAAAVSQYNQFKDMPDEVFAVFDMGGGTTDVAIFEKRKGELWCLGSGSAQVGGDNLDQVVKDLSLSKIAAWPIQATGIEARRTFGPFFERINELREELSRQAEVRRTFVLPEGEFELRLTREEFEKKVDFVVGRSVDVLVRTYEGVSPILDRFEKKLAGIYLVGGVTETPVVQRRVFEAIRDRASGVEVREATEFSGVQVSPSVRDLFEREFHILSVALGAGFPRENFREYILDKIPFEIGLVLSRDENLEEYPTKKLLPFYHAFEAVPKTQSHDVLVSQNPGNVLNLYMKREVESFYKIIKYLKFPFRQGRRIRYMPPDERIDEPYRIRMEITKDLIVVHFGDIAREKVFVPGSHPYYIQKDIRLDWVERLSTVQDLAHEGQRVDAVGIQNYLRRMVHERDPVRLVKNEEGRVLVLHEDQVIGFLQDRVGASDWDVKQRRPILKLVREDILLPEDLGVDGEINPYFQPGDKFIVYDIEMDE